MPAWHSSSSTVCPTISAPSASVTAGATSMTRSDWSRPQHYPSSATCVRGLAFGRAPSTVFNRVLAARVAEGRWAQAQVGDLLAFTDSRSFFPAGEAECADPRLAILDLHPDRPDVGWGATRPQAAPPRSWKMPSAHGSRHFAGGWRRRHGSRTACFAAPYWRPDMALSASLTSRALEFACAGRMLRHRSGARSLDLVSAGQTEQPMRILISNDDGVTAPRPRRAARCAGGLCRSAR